MDSASPEQAVFDETVVFLNYFKSLDDPRQQGKVTYLLNEILLLCLLRRFRPFAEGTPTHDRLGDILAVLDAGQFQRCFAAWAAATTGLPEGVIAIDGKTSRRSGSKTKNTTAIHVVSAFSAHRRLVLGQVEVAEKSNEIVAIPKLLDLLTIEGAIVTIDAMGCQREIAAKIVGKKADYILALKGNQGSLREEVGLFVAEQQANGFEDTEITRHETVDADHGRIETRTVTVLHDVAWLSHRHAWPGLKAVAIVESTRETGTKIEKETRFYITSLTAPAATVGPAIRSHWSIENSLHWVMDMTLRDDECRVRKNNAPANFAVIRHMAHNLIRMAPGKQSIRLRRMAAAWDDDYLASFIIT